jgi:hypothetical protein
MELNQVYPFLPESKINCLDVKFILHLLFTRYNSTAGLILLGL